MAVPAGSVTEETVTKQQAAVLRPVSTTAGRFLARRRSSAPLNSLFARQGHPLGQEVGRALQGALAAYGMGVWDR